MSAELRFAISTQRLKMENRNALVLTAFASLLVLSLPASATELSYTFMDFQVLDTKVDAAGALTPVLGQTVTVNTGEGDGIGIAGSVAIGERFYLHGMHLNSIIDVTGRVQSPLATANVNGQFDLLLTTLGVGYKHEIGEKLDLFAELNYDRAEYDFGSFAGENFDPEGSGASPRVGFRWNPTRQVEVYAAARHSPNASVVLSRRDFESDTLVGAGLRWFFFSDLGIGVDYESGDVDTLKLSMRFSFGTLPW